MRLLSASQFAAAVTGYGSPISLEVLDYDTCLVAHPPDVALWEGPRQGYQLNPTTFRSIAAAVGQLSNSH